MAQIILIPPLFHKHLWLPGGPIWTDGCQEGMLDQILVVDHTRTNPSLVAFGSEDSDRRSYSVNFCIFVIFALNFCHIEKNPDYSLKILKCKF